MEASQWKNCKSREGEGQRKYAEKGVKCERKKNVEIEGHKRNGN